MERVDVPYKFEHAIGKIKIDLEMVVRESIIDSLVFDMLKKLETEIRTVVTPMVSEITIDQIEKYTNYLRMRDELHIFLKWKDSPENNINKVINEIK